ncbi:MAG TPA: hypothetical protein RMF84_18560 [Polyangiaceae bacterium LLY-WYZ-14_1]|nr:hypothetical protein [Polyangiaceae bacterium LLY-WYZ-14_1]
MAGEPPLSGGASARPTRPLRDALRPRSWWPAALALELAFGVLAVLPVAWAAGAELAPGLARATWVTDLGRPLPLVPLAVLLGEVVAAVATPAAAALGLSLLGHWAVLAAVLTVLRREVGGLPVAPLEPLDRLPAAAGRHLGAFLRVAAAALGGLVVVGLVARSVGAAAAALVPDTALAALTLGALRALVFALGAWMVGAGALLARVLLVVDDRRRVRRVLPMVLRVWLRAPVIGLLLPTLASVLAAVPGAVALGGWRDSGGASAWVVAAVVAMVLRALVGLVVAGALVRLVAGHPGLDELRRTPDAPFGVLSRLRERLREWLRGPPGAGQPER